MSLDNLLKQSAEPAMNGEIITRPENLPAIAAKPGWKTSQGQMTAVFIVASMVLSYFGYQHFTPERIETIYGLIVVALVVLGPLLPASWNLTNYINSRGKIQSNTIWATADVIKSATGQQPLSAEPITGTQTQVLDTIKSSIQLGGAIVPDSSKAQVIFDEAENVVGVIDLVSGIFHKTKQIDNNKDKQDIDPQRR